MTAVRRIWDEFIYGGRLLALGLVCKTVMAAWLLAIAVTWDLIVVIYLLALGPCLFGRLVDLKADLLSNPTRSRYLQGQVRVIPYIIAIVIVAMLGLLI